MEKLSFPSLQTEWLIMNPQQEVASLMTPIALIEGEVLSYLEEHGTATAKKLVDELKWPATLVLMGIGALVRSGLIQAKKIGYQVLLLPINQPT